MQDPPRSPLLQPAQLRGRKERELQCCIDVLRARHGQRTFAVVRNAVELAELPLSPESRPEKQV
ncbi:MAG: hypothetical protein AAGA11_22745 [Pseudomonadota bacterium]